MDMLSILIVDDDRSTRRLLSMYLQDIDCITTTAEDGRQAIDLVTAGSFDLILLDMKMPGIAGIEVLKTLRQQHSLYELPIIVISVMEENEEIMNAFQYGANDYIQKPVDPTVLIARTEKQVELKRISQTGKIINVNFEQLAENRIEQLDQVNETLQNERIHFEYLLSASPSVTYVLNVNSGHLSTYICSYISTNVHKLTGYKPVKMMNNPDFWFMCVHPEDRQKMVEQIEKNLELHGGGTVEYRILHFNGEYMWISDSNRLVMENDKPVEIIGTLTDVTKEHKLKEEIYYKETHDRLTGLINRKSFEKQIGKLLDSHIVATVQHVICYLDIDQFKIINESHGNVAGDELLRQVGKMLQDQLTRQDILAYLGGDEFGIIIQHCTLNQALQSLEFIQKALNEARFVWGEKKYAITVSIGVVSIDKNTDTSVDILSIADSACFAAKEAGRNRIQIYTESDGSLGQQREQMSWVERITRALDEDYFLLYYQPIVALNDHGGDKYFELLIRMKDESGGLILPDAFLPAAEYYNLSSKIDHWVIQTTLSWLESYSELLEQNYIWNINLSGQSLSDEGLLKFVCEEFERKQIPPNKVCFEITETAAIENLRNATYFINTLRKQGCQFALDDFGSGLSSFSYLKNLPVDFLKIDGVFVKDMATDNTGFAMVEAIHNISQTMGKQTMAEFVENNETIENLKKIGVDYAQGYGVRKPMPLHEFEPE